MMDGRPGTLGAEAVVALAADVVLVVLVLLLLVLVEALVVVLDDGVDVFVLGMDGGFSSGPTPTTDVVLLHVVTASAAALEHGVRVHFAQRVGNLHASSSPL